MKSQEKPTKGSLIKFPFLGHRIGNSKKNQNFAVIDSIIFCIFLNRLKFNYYQTRSQEWDFAGLIDDARKWSTSAVSQFNVHVSEASSQTSSSHRRLSTTTLICQSSTTTRFHIAAAQQFAECASEVVVENGVEYRVDARVWVAKPVE